MVEITASKIYIDTLQVNPQVFVEFRSKKVENWKGINQQFCLSLVLRKLYTSVFQDWNTHENEIIIARICVSCHIYSIFLTLIFL